MNRHEPHLTKAQRRTLGRLQRISRCICYLLECVLLMAPPICARTLGYQTGPICVGIAVLAASLLANLYCWHVNHSTHEARRFTVSFMCADLLELGIIICSFIP